MVLLKMLSGTSSFGTSGSILVSTGKGVNVWELVLKSGDVSGQAGRVVVQSGAGVRFGGYVVIWSGKGAQSRGESYEKNRRKY